MSRMLLQWSDFWIGINTPDHETQFEQIVSHLRSDHHYVALLQSKDCGNIRNMTKTMIEQFLSETMVNDDQHEPMEEVKDICVLYTSILTCNI